jgi:DNA-binding response OmpR family regulator
MYALLVAHNVDESAALRLALQRAGFAVRISTDLSQAIQEWPGNPSDLTLITFPKNPQVEQIRQFRAQGDIPLIVICQPIDEDLHVALLETCVDLVVFRPYSLRLLIAQLRMMIKRAERVPLFTLPTLAMGGLTLDPSERTVQAQGSSVKRLTPLEFRLLYTLMMHAERVVPTETIVEHVWGYDGRGDKDLVRGLVKRLRSKVEPNPHEPLYIHTVSGIGYRLDIPES